MIENKFRIKDSFIKNVLILFAITSITGILLGVAHEFTKNEIEKQLKKSSTEAYQAVFEDARIFNEYKTDMDKIEEYLDQCGIKNNVAEIESIFTAQKETGGQILGYVITVISKEGYSGDIKFTVGIQNDGTVNGVSVVTINETVGLGMKAAQDTFLDQFAIKKVDAFIMKADPTGENEIDVISNATITTKAMVNGVNACIYCFQAITGEEAPM